MPAGCVWTGKKLHLSVTWFAETRLRSRNFSQILISYSKVQFTTKKPYIIFGSNLWIVKNWLPHNEWHKRQISMVLSWKFTSLIPKMIFPYLYLLTWHFTTLHFYFFIGKYYHHECRIITTNYWQNSLKKKTTTVPESFINIETSVLRKLQFCVLNQNK